MYKALYLSPMIPSFNIRETTLFFTDLFNFEIARDEGNYVIVYKDNHLIHILNAGLNTGEMEFYLEVDEIDSLWRQVADQLTDIKVKPPFNQDYGMREFHLIVPFTKTLMFVGQTLS